MTLSAVASVTSLLLFPGLMIWAGTRDILTMSISNRLVLVLLAGYAVLAPASGFQLDHIAWSAAVAAVVFMGWPVPSADGHHDRC
jgi:prepilin peptidase CpaA